MVVQRFEDGLDGISKNGMLHSIILWEVDFRDREENYTTKVLILDYSYGSRSLCIDGGVKEA